MARNSRLALAAMAGMNQRALIAAFDSGSLSKSDFRTILALRASGTATDEIAKCIGGKVIRDFKLRKIGRVISKYAQKRVQEVTPMVTAERLLEERVAKSRDTQRMISEAIHKYQAEHPGVSRQNAIDAVLYGAQVREIVKLERQLDEMAKLGGGNLPTPRPGTMHRTHNDPAPVLGRTGYDAALDDRPPGTATATGGPQSGADLNPIIRDHHQTLADIASGKINETDPKFRALRALEMKRLYEKG